MKTYRRFAGIVVFAGSASDGLRVLRGSPVDLVTCELND